MKTNVISFHTYVKRPSFCMKCYWNFYLVVTSQDDGDVAAVRIARNRLGKRSSHFGGFFRSILIFYFGGFFRAILISIRARKLLQFEKVFQFDMKAQEMKKSFSVKNLHQRTRKISSAIK